ncbi:MAG: hypothetical protein C4317_09380, partial [Acidimicrobiia bacterium]
FLASKVRDKSESSMRVIAGKAKGTPLAAPKLASVRPMTDRAKEALFSHLGDRLHQAKVLDLFTGSGSLAIEALSRGASSAVMVDASKSAIRVARDNAIRCGFDNKASFFCDDVWRFVCRLESSYNFDVVFVDPPYAIEDKRIAKLLEDLGSRLRHGATVCLHRERARLGPPRQYVGAR